MAEGKEALKKAQRKYMEKFSVARVRTATDRYEDVKAHAEAHSESVNGFINRAIDTRSWSRIKPLLGQPASQQRVKNR